jgi:hypothetical protein
LHQACKENRDLSVKQMGEIATKVALGGGDLSTLDQQLAKVGRAGLVPFDWIRGILLQSWEQAIDQTVKTNVLSDEQVRSLQDFANKYSFSISDLNRNGAGTRVAMSLTLRDVMEGRMPRVPPMAADLPFNLRPSEQMIWGFRGTRYYLERVHRMRVGSYNGVSVRVAKGVYWHTGGSMSIPVEIARLDHIDTGALGISSENVYFGGAHKSFRIPFKKIVSFHPYADGLGFFRDSASASHEIFVIGGDSWFLFNLVQNLAHEGGLAARDTSSQSD